MVDAAQPLPATDVVPAPEAQARDTVMENPGTNPTPTPTAEKASKGKGLWALRDRIARRRSYTTQHSSFSSPTLVSPTSEQPVDVQEATCPVPSPKRTKSITFERLLTSKLGAKKGGKNDSGPIAVALDPAPSNSSASTQPGSEKTLSAIPEGEATGLPLVDAAAEGSDAAPTDTEALPLARKIHSLLSSVPPFLSTVDPPQDSDKKDGDASKAPNTPSPIPDSRLLLLLSSPSFMNGSLSRGRQSVWAMLDNLRLKALKSNEDAGLAPPERKEAVLEDTDSVMFYIPLVPDDTSSVELARSEIVSVDENGNIVEVLLEDAPPPQSPSTKSDLEAEGFKWHWPWHRDTPKPTPKPKTIEKRVWVPSTEKLSLQVMWWGYRLWLPPPVLAMLNDKQIEAAKQAAMITTALQWVLNNVPESVLPPTLRPALMLVKSLVPYLGYIGGFVAWSWSAIKGFDVGFGVTLTATWLLPIALIPGTWEEKDVPKPPAPSDPDPSTPVPSDPPSGGPTAPPANPPPPSPGNPSAPPSTGDPSVPPSNDPATPPTATTCPPTPPTSPTTDPIPSSGPSIM